MLKRLSPRIRADDPRRRLALGAACVLATLVVAQFLVPALTRSAVPELFMVSRDTYISEQNPDLVHGALPYLKVDGGPMERSTYLRVDIPASRASASPDTRRRGRWGCSRRLAATSCDPSGILAITSPNTS